MNGTIFQQLKSKPWVVLDTFLSFSILEAHCYWLDLNNDSVFKVKAEHHNLEFKAYGEEKKLYKNVVYKILGSIVELFNTTGLNDPEVLHHVLFLESCC